MSKESDDAWRDLNNQVLDASVKQNWVDYRMARFKMARQLEHEGRSPDRALEYYLEVYYLDVNSPNNSPHDIRPPFTPNIGYPVKAVIAGIKDITKSLELSEEQLEELFIKIATRTQDTLMTPVPINYAWEQLANSISGIKEFMPWSGHIPDILPITPTVTQQPISETLSSEQKNRLIVIVTIVLLLIGLAPMCLSGTMTPFYWVCLLAGIILALYLVIRKARS